MKNISGHITVLLFLAFIIPQTSLSAQEKTDPEKESNEIVRFSNSESPDISFIINTNPEKCLVRITTNYPSSYKIRFIDYWGKSVRVDKDLTSGKQIDVSEFKNQVMIMNIMDNQNNRLLSSQVVNLKRRNYW